MNEKAKNYLNLLYQRPVLVGQLLGFTDLGDIHNEWIRRFVYDEQDQTLLAHRGSYKTTSLSIAIAILMVLNPAQNIIFMRKTDTDVVEIITQVANILESSIMREIIKEVHGIELKFIKRSGGEIDTNMNYHNRGTSQLIGLGITSSLTGKHGEIIITDDIVNPKDRQSRAERETTKRVYMELQNIKNPSGRFINTGTPWHKKDAISLMPNVVKYDVYQTGLLTTEQIRDLQKEMTVSLFAANYELKHIADEESMFDNPNYTEDEQGIYDGIAHIDAAYGGGDGTAFTIAKKIGGKYIVFGKLWKKHVDDCMAEIKRYHEVFRAGTIYNEMNADKGYLAKELRSDGYLVSTYHEKENKYIKIATILRKEWDNIYFLEGTDPDYISEILDYNENAEHDDAPDSLASALRAIENMPKKRDTREVISNLRRLGL